MRYNKYRILPKQGGNAVKKILFIASEAVPFIKTGGLADVVGSLPKYFDKEQYDIRVMIPKYLCIKQEWRDKMNYVTHFYMNLAWRSQYVGVLEMEYDGVKFYFIDNEYYFAGPKPYGNIYEDIEKFAFFSKAAISALPSLNFRPDIIHCHDWQTGLVPVFLNDSFQNNPFFQGIKTVMTIHNLKFQGIWDMKTVKDITGLGLKDAKGLVDGAPSVIKEGVAKDEAEELKAKLEEVGAKVTLK